MVLPWPKRRWPWKLHAGDHKVAAGEGPKAKAPVPPKGAGSKKEPGPLAGKAEASKGPRKPGIPTKSSVSKAASKKAEAEG